MHSNKKVIVVAPHPDDETLGCGGTLLRHIADGDEVHWLIVTSIDELTMFSEERKTSRRAEIEAVTAAYGFHKTHKLAFDSMSLDTISKGKVIGAISQIFNDVEPDTVYLPYRLDAHSDHEVVFDALLHVVNPFAIRLSKLSGPMRLVLRPSLECVLKTVAFVPIVLLMCQPIC